ncbi:hypothetical protein H4582DRAFT_2103855 [Lactarius indigo]|nr:hypothetical protein H4582DRAFT_2103855 [Lactarius indigo]
MAYCNDPTCDIPGLAGKIYLRTESSGIGFHVAKQLYACMGGTVYLACWSEVRAHAAMVEVEGEVGIALVVRGPLVLASQLVIKAAADEFAWREERPNALTSEPRESYIARWTIVQYARRGASAANTRGGGGVCITCGQELIQERPHTRLIKTAALSRKGCERAGSDIKATIAKLLAK